MTDNTTYSVPEPFGPRYPTLPGLTKFRRNPAIAGYGAAVLEAIRQLQRTELDRAGKAGYTRPIQCASGTTHTNGRKILAAVAQQNRAAASKDFPVRSPDRERADYEAAMAGMPYHVAGQ